MLKISFSVIVLLVLSLTNTSAKTCTKDLMHSYIIHKMDSITQKLNPMRQYRKSVIFICCEGYREVSRRHFTPKCEPICEQSCTNGVCVAANFCQCNFGYEKTEMGTCELRTTTPLLIPTTTAPDEKIVQINQLSSTATPLIRISNESDLNTSLLIETSLLSTKVPCPPGFEQTPDKGCEISSTTPTLTSTRTQSYTTTELPAKIVCPVGYNQNMDGKCQPICHHSCLQNRCLSPNQCECAPGYVHDSELALCRPLCNGKIYGCIDGTCIAYNQCRCDNGTVLHENELFHCKAKENLERTAFNKTWLLLLIIPAGLAFVAYFLIQRTRRAKWNRLNAQTYPDVKLQTDDAKLAFANQLEVENELYGTAD